jgi:outer membrane murein-binding lipoprotein Lpp
MVPASRDARPTFRLAGSLVLAAAIVGALMYAAARPAAAVADDRPPNAADAASRETQELRAAVDRLKADLQQAKADATAAQAEAREAKTTAAEAKSAAAAAAGELERLSTAYRELQKDKTFLLPLADRVVPDHVPQLVPAPPPVNLHWLHWTIKAKRTINGVGYATISLGSAQNVTKGMQFRIIEAGNFLGYLTVVNVETDESIGSFTGPDFNKVKPGLEMRTQ